MGVGSGSWDRRVCGAGDVVHVRASGDSLVGKAFGFVVLDADLRGASVTIEPVPIGFVATSEVVVISDATIHRRISLVARGHYLLTLGYGTWIGREQRQRWLREISSRS